MYIIEGGKGGHEQGRTLNKNVIARITDLFWSLVNLIYICCKVNHILSEIPKLNEKHEIIRRTLSNPL